MTRRRPQTLRGRRLLAAAGLLWALAVGAGYSVLLRYEVTPGPVGKPAPFWPEASVIPRPPGRSTLIMLAHPRCPCTRASLEELAQVMRRCRRPLGAYVLFYRPIGFDSEWVQTDLWRQASAIPGVQVLEDDDGVEARRLGAATSGHVVVYDETGRRRFSGGITPARGHAGDNAGRETVIRLLKREEVDRQEGAVFGCPLLRTREVGREGPSPCRQ